MAQRKDWLALVAVHSDAWLMAVAFYYGAKFDAKERCDAGQNLGISLQFFPRSAVCRGRTSDPSPPRRVFSR